MQGDIGYFPFVQLAKRDESGLLPNASVHPAVKGIPALDGLEEAPVTLNGSQYLLRHWHGFGIVIDVTSELARRPEDSRVTVAPLIPRDASGLSWDTAVCLQYAGVLPLPQAEKSSIGEQFPPADWPDVLLAARSATTLTRDLVIDGRLMTLTPRMAAVLSAKLAEMFGARQWARLRHFDNVLGQRLEAVDDVGRDEGPPIAGRWALLHFENHERLQVFVSAKD